MCVCVHSCAHVCMSIGSFVCAHMCKALTGVYEVCTLIHTRVCAVCMSPDVCVLMDHVHSHMGTHVSTQVWCVCTCFHNDVCPDGALPIQPALESSSAP